MKLSEKEEKMIARLRTRVANEVRLRYWNLAGGILFALAAGYVAFELENFPKEFPDAAVVTFATFMPGFYALCAFTGITIGKTIRDWNGNPERTLLLKLLDEAKQRQTES